VEQSRKDTATRAAWITGGFALAGTLITLLFTSNVLAGSPGGGTTSSPAADPPPVSISTPPPAIPEGVEGHWKGGGAISENFHLTIANDTSWTLINGNDVQAGHVAEGKVIFSSSQATFYYNDGRPPLVVDWAIAKTPTNTVLHLGTFTYTRQ
jgi:hypothetical protein